jgi:hypothetical protein
MAHEGAQAVREMEWTMMRERVDMANHRFWVRTGIGQLGSVC